MLNLLIDDKHLKIVTPPKMNIGSFYTFIENDNLFGVGQQAVHNSGSSMMRDTPNFKQDVLNFLENHIDFNEVKINNINDIGLNKFFDIQKSSLECFKKDSTYRKDVLDNVFIQPFEFSTTIDIDYLVISLMLYFVKKYNCFHSTQVAHSVTKKAFVKHFKNENVFLSKVNSLLVSENELGYLLDVCFGRYYFLEIHFEFRNSNGEIRNTPLQIFQEFLEIGYQSVDFIDTNSDASDEVREQSRINISDGYETEDDISKSNNRNPEQGSSSSSDRFKTDSRLAKTVIKRASFTCEYDELHETFLNKKGDNYMEAHHIIPMSKQSEFLPINVDRTENIVSICPNCHKAIHYGSDTEKAERLQKLFDSRKEKLQAIGITIDFSTLLTFYGIKNI